MRTPHTSCKKGKRVRLILKNGQQIISKFIEYKKGKFVILESGKYGILDIRAFSIYKQLAGDTSSK